MAALISDITSEALTDADVAILRADTPSSGRWIHLSAAGASPSPTPVLETHVEHLEREVEVGGYLAEAEAAGNIDQVYESAARLLSVTPREIAIVDSST